MDSFYELPRSVPVPTSTKKLATAPIVPEVSMIFHNEPNGNLLDSVELPYKTWKTYSKDINSKSLPEGNSIDSECVLRQVRFANADNYVPQNPNILPPNGNLKLANRTANTVSFEHIYMANIPNRKLDLSLIERPYTTKQNRENVDPNRNKLSITTHPNSIDKTAISHKTLIDGNKIGDLLKVGQIDQKVQSSNCYLIPTTESNVFKKNNVIDIYNYKCDDRKDWNTIPDKQYILDNTDVYCATGDNDHPSKKNNSIKPPSFTYKSFEPQSYESNQQRCAYSKQKQLLTNNKNSIGIQTETYFTKKESLDSLNKDNEEPTVKDLLKIIYQQNDQLMLLQNQVASLLNDRNAPKQIKEQTFPIQDVNLFGDKCRTSTQLESQGLSAPLQHYNSRNPSLPQFSLDVMTSFEVSIRRQQNLNKAHKEIMNRHPKICEVSENESIVFDNYYDGISNKKSSNNTDVSLTLNEPVQVPETCLSPVNTVKIDMEDYSSDEDEEMNCGNQWFYKNVKGQVSQILRKSGIWAGNPPMSQPSDLNNALPSNIRKKVEEATIKHLKSIGVYVPILENNEDTHGGNSSTNMGCTSNDISFLVKQLLMKYLPNEQLTKLTENIGIRQPMEYTGLIKRRPEFSFATVQYMQKYNLLTETSNPNQPETIPIERQNDNFDRILDITAIRRQPKLL